MQLAAKIASAHSTSTRRGVVFGRDDIQLFLQREVTSRDRIAPDGGRMTIRALHRLVLLPLGHLVCDRGLEIVARTLLCAVEGIAMARRTRKDRDVRVLHRLCVRVLRNADMAGHAILARMVLLRVVELYRIAIDLARRLVGLRKRMASGTVAARGFDPSEMARKTRLMTERHRLEVRCFDVYLLRRGRRVGF